MSIERETVHVATDNPYVKTEEELAAEIAITEARKEKKVRFARVLDRGFIVDRLNVEDDCPPELHAEWVSTDPVEIERKRALGFEIVTAEWAKKRSLHGDGTDRAVVGDVVLMSCSTEDYEIQQEVRQERFNELHGPRSNQKEEQEFKTRSKIEAPMLPVIDKGSAKPLSKG